MPVEGFNVDEWRQLRRAVSAGIKEDADTMAAELRNLDRMFKMSGRSGAYLVYSIRYRVGERLQRRPSEEDPTHLSEDAYPRFGALVNSGPEALTELLCFLFEFRDRPGWAHDGMLIVNGAAALSALIDDEADLDDIEPDLADWYNENKDEFRILQPPGT